MAEILNTGKISSDKVEIISVTDKIVIAETDIKAEKLVLPKGYKLVKEPDPAEELQKEIDMLEAEFSQMIKPTDEELIEWGKLCHPYYELKIRLDILKDELKKFE